MISETIKKQIIEAMKAKDEITLSTLKMLSSALTNAEIEKKREKLSEEEEIKVVKSEAKKRKDAIEMYEAVLKAAGSKNDNANVSEKLEREKKELAILEKFLPEEMGDEDLEKVVLSVIDEIGAKNMGDMGKVMGVAMKKTEGKADGSRISKIVKEKLA